MKEFSLPGLRQRQIYAEMLRGCSKNQLLEQGVQVHGALVATGFGFDSMLNNDLIDMYGKCGRVVLARHVFDRMPERNLVAWTSLMCGYVQDGYPEESLSLFSQLGSTGLKPNDFTLSTNLKACGMLSVPKIGMQLHDICVKTAYDLQTVVANTILDMYSKCGRIGEAASVFATMPVKNLISWNAMIAAYNLTGKGKKALGVFREMREEGEVPDEFTLTSSLKACTKLGAAREAAQIHASLITGGFHYSDKATVGGSLIDSYVKCGELLQARRVFDQIEKKHLISWSALILGYAQEEKLGEAMDLFKLLRVGRIQVDEYVLSSMMAIFADFALVEQGRQVHGFSLKIPSGLRISVCNSALDMYLKCGMIEDAEKLFGEMSAARDVVSWTVMITGYGKHGLGKEAVHLFNRMLLQNIKPDDVTYLAILLACSHSGLVEEGEDYLSKLCSDERIKPRVEHYACVVDLLGRAGRLKEAKSLICTMPVEPNAGIWQTLLSACRVHGDIEMGREVGNIILRMDGNNPVNYVMLSNMYANAGYWEESQTLREMVTSKKLKKEAGRSWVEIDKEIHLFYGGDDKHPLGEQIRKVLVEMGRRMKQELGYVTEVKHELHDIDEESKQESLRVHSEKLAIGMALLCGGWEKRRVIRVFKNLRVCVDCHEFIKGLSRILQVGFVVRDANRFHKFENGLCSCRDYW
ncbi:Putative pentatricopeptide repeat-containing protein At3g15130 [Linum grandiflorum]